MNENLIGNSKEMVDFLGDHYQYNCLGCEISNKKLFHLEDLFMKMILFF